MRKSLPLMMCISAFLMTLGIGAFAEDLDREYRQVLADYFDVPSDLVDEVFATALSDEDVPVVFYLSQRANMHPMRVAEIRLEEHSWMSICTVRGLSPADFHIIAAGEIESETYEPIFEKYSSTPKFLWHEINLTDGDVVNLVNLKVIASHNDYSIFEIMSLRDESADFAELNHEVAGLKAAWCQRFEAEQKLLKAGMSGGS